MKKQIQNKVFYTGFAVGFLIFIIFNYFSYLHNICPTTIDDCGWSFGFPAYFYSEGGFFSLKEIIWLGLFIDIFFAFIFSLLIGWLLKISWSRIKV